MVWRVVRSSSALLVELVELHKLVLDQDVMDFLLGLHRQPRRQCFQRGGDIPGEELGGRLLSFVHQQPLGGQSFVHRGHRRRRRSLGGFGWVAGVRHAVVKHRGGVVVGARGAAALVGVIDGLEKKNRDERFKLTLLLLLLFFFGHFYHRFTISPVSYVGNFETDATAKS